MICNELYDGQGLGNQLWNYAVTRIIADKNKYAFAILAPERFKGADFIKIDFGQTVSPGISIEGGPVYTLPTGITQYYRERKECIKGTSIDISHTDPLLLTLSDSTKFDGNCQSTQYLEGYRDRILTWITVHQHIDSPLPRNTCVIHIRFGDFTNNTDVFLPAQYYIDAMSYLKNINPDIDFAIVTDEKHKAETFLPGIPVIGAAALGGSDRRRASHHLGGPVGIDFTLLQQATYLIIPNSSFSWWAAYLNTTAHIIIAPKYWARYNTADGFWSTGDIITDEFTYMGPDAKPYTASQCRNEKEIFEATHQDHIVEISQNMHATLTDIAYARIINTKGHIRHFLQRLLK